MTNKVNGFKIEFQNEASKQYAIGELYFTPGRNERNQPVTNYEGVVAGFIIKRDDGSEFEVRATKSLPYSKLPLTKRDLETLKAGEELQDVASNTKYVVTRVYGIYGDVWVKNIETGKTEAKKFTTLRRPSI